MLTSIATAATTYTIDYNNWLTRSIADNLYCMINSDCELNSLVVDNLTVLNYFNVTVNNTYITGNFTIEGDLNVTGSGYFGGNVTFNEAVYMLNCTEFFNHSNYYKECWLGNASRGMCQNSTTGRGITTFNLTYTQENSNWELCTK